MKKTLIIFSILITLFFSFTLYTYASFTPGDLDGSGLYRLENAEDYWSCVDYGASNCDSSWQFYGGGTVTPPRPTAGGGSCSYTDFKSVVNCVVQIVLKPIPPLIVGFALLMFLWGATKYINSGGNEKERAKGVGFMSYGVIALFVMVSVWGLVGLLTSTFFGGNPPSAPLKPTIRY